MFRYKEGDLFLIGLALFRFWCSFDRLAYFAGVRSARLVWGRWLLTSVGAQMRSILSLKCFLADGVSKEETAVRIVS